MAAALKIQGRKGRHELINCTYEPMVGQEHNGKSVWVSRTVQPLYIFHTGKARWVVSKRMDDGAKCYAFIKDSSAASPADVKDSWVCCADDNEWRADPAVSCVPAAASNDKFLQLRMSLDSELKQCGMNIDTQADLKALWKRLDYNGNNVVSLAEIDKMVVEMVAGGTWPAWLNNKPALMRAYKKTTLVDGDGDDWVEKHEFHALLLNIVWFNKLWQVFSVMDGGDRRIDVDEFTRSLSSMGLQLSPQEAAEEFKKMDTNGGGQVLFVEFCAYVRKRINPDHDPAFDGDIVSGENCGKVLRKTHGHKVTHTHMVKKKNLSMFDELEVKIKALMGDPAKLKELWTRMDFNGNQIVSLAEIDKLVVEAYPLLNHKPALMRAYQATIKAGNGDDWCRRRNSRCSSATSSTSTNSFGCSTMWIRTRTDALTSTSSSPC